MQEDDAEDDDEAAMQAMMGFGGFGTTQVSGSLIHPMCWTNALLCSEQAYCW
jgi:hypothetical protein